jgi:hypothetical protein
MTNHRYQKKETVLNYPLYKNRSTIVTDTPPFNNIVSLCSLNANPLFVANSNHRCHAS